MVLVFLRLDVKNNTHIIYYMAQVITLDCSFKYVFAQQVRGERRGQIQGCYICTLSFLPSLLPSLPPSLSRLVTVVQDVIDP